MNIAPPISVQCTKWLATDPPTPCPDLLTNEQAVVYLRLDKAGGKNPLKSLENYRQTGLLRGIRIGRSLMYPIGELERFVRHLWEEQHPRMDWPDKETA